MNTVIEMAREAQIVPYIVGPANIEYIGRLERFAALVRAEALAEQPAQQEPVAWMYESVCGNDFATRNNPPKYAKNIRPLGYTSPPAQQEPVGEVVLEGLIGDSQVVRFHMYKEIPPVGAKLYVSPPQRIWVGLTDDELHTCWNDAIATPHYSRESVYEAIEAKLKEKNT